MFNNEREAAEAYLGTGAVYGLIALGFMALGMMVYPDNWQARLGAYIMGASMLSICVYCLYVAYCGLAD